MPGGLHCVVLSPTVIDMSEYSHRFTIDPNFCDLCGVEYAHKDEQRICYPDPEIAFDIIHADTLAALQAISTGASVECLGGNLYGIVGHIAGIDYLITHVGEDGLTFDRAAEFHVTIEWNEEQVYDTRSRNAITGLQLAFSMLGKDDFRLNGDPRSMLSWDELPIAQQVAHVLHALEVQA